MAPGRGAKVSWSEAPLEPSLSFRERLTRSGEQKESYWFRRGRSEMWNKEQLGGTTVRERFIHDRMGRWGVLNKQTQWGSDRKCPSATAVGGCSQD